MPGFNQTGPMGQGPMTGRRMGRCANLGTSPKNPATDSNENANENVPDGFQGRGFGCRGGRGRQGFGMGRQNRFRGNF